MSEEPARAQRRRPATDLPDNGVHFSLRVRYAETDQMRRAHHAHYLTWFEAARAEFCRIRGIDYTQMEADGLYLPIAEVSCRYAAPAHYDDLLDIYVAVTELRRATLRAVYLVTRGETRIAQGETLSVLVGADGRPRTFPADLAGRFITVQALTSNPTAGVGASHLTCDPRSFGRGGDSRED